MANFCGFWHFGRKSAIGSECLDADSRPDKDALIAELKAALAARDTLIETLRFQLAQLRRLFWPILERLANQIEQL
jgi:hypothetical protein